MKMLIKHILNRLTEIRRFERAALVALTGALLVATVSPTQAGLRAGAAAYALGDHVRAIREFEKAAEQDNAKAMIRLGDIHREGEDARHNG